ncbi:type VI secretion system baseplate subunit TssF [Tropicibacter alexandrii]|uniref:type VI secretion system baseplate subunit TssF n=1 Tax=Tropicibacter alexandrii TaxID=2267683 RepID=UPI000EF47592|nr:type VI secretion system baseplate subunit TssF [Tropicibacter alexandrii]
MKKAFRDLYNTELALLKERARDFAQEYPGLADRLGGLLEENLDPTVAGLLEGSAFLAARVQLKMAEEFRGFTREMLDQLLPGLMEPTPSVMMVRARVPCDDPDVVNGVHFDRGDYIEARYLDAEKRVPCRFSLSGPLSLWPLEIAELRYLSSPGQVGAVGQEIAKGTRAGLLLDIARLGIGGVADGTANLTELTADALTFRLMGPFEDAVALYEQIFCGRVRASLRWQNALGDDVFMTLPPHAIEQIGFGEDEQVLRHDARLFRGFALLRDMFVFPRSFLGFRLTGLRNLWPRIPGANLQLVFEFDTSNHRLATQLDRDHLTLNAAPAINLFEETAGSIRLDRKRHEHVVTPLSSPVTHYEFHRLTDVLAHYKGSQNWTRVLPLYALPKDGSNPRTALYFTQRRRRRRQTSQELRHGVSRYRYRGTETLISLYEPPDEEPAQRLEVRGLCSNRHLPEYLPIKQGSDDFYFCDETSIKLACIEGPTLPRDSLADLENSTAHRNKAGDVYWRLISHLSLNAYGILGRDGTESAAALREMLTLFADLSDTFTEAQIAGLHLVETRQVTASIPHPEGYHTARGVEVTLTFDEDAFEGSGVMLMGAVLDRFLAEYVSVNSFTKTVIRTRQRGHVKTWPPRLGGGHIL